MKFDLFAKLTDEIEDFETQGIYIVGKPTELDKMKGADKGKRGGYYFSQRELLEAVDLACASKFKRGYIDEEGQRKTYLNIVNFYRDVMKMKINIDVANYIFEPTSLDFTWPVWFMDRNFKQWAQDESYDDQIDEYGHDLSTYGTTVTKRLKNCTERVPLRTIKNSQKAKSLYDAAANGGYVIIDSELHYNKMKEYKDWNIEGLNRSKKYCVYERYALVPEKLLKNDLYKTQAWCDTSETDEMVLAMSVMIKDANAKDNKHDRVLYMQKIDESSFPLEECHIEKVDGRWLGRGEVEKQLENQISRNLTANLRRRGLLWATKKIYQSSDEEIQKNLVMEVKDGEVIHVKANGLITQVNTQNQQLGDFAADEQVWKENSQQISFAFEAATGETMPSGTPFSLQVSLAAQVASHFELARATFSNFLKRSFFDQLVPIFQEEYQDEHETRIRIGESDIENLKEAILNYHMNVRIFDMVIKNEPVNKETIKASLAKEMALNPYLFVKMEEDAYKNIQYYMRLNLTDDNGPDIKSLTSLYQAMAAKGDPRADVVLKMIFAKQGKALDALAGAPAIQPQTVAQQPQGAQGSPTPSPIQMRTPSATTV